MTISAAVPTLGMLAIASAAWRAVSLWAWVGDVASVAAWAVYFGGFSVWSIYVRRWVRVAAWATAAAATALSALRLAHLPAGRWNSANSWPLLLLVAISLALVASRRAELADAVSIPLRVPLQDGEWYIVQGGGRLINHHARVRPQRGAIDLVRLRPDGRRAAGLCPTRLGSYAAYGSVVVAPCDGVVRAVVDSLEDEAPLRPRLVPPKGNYVAIDTDSESVILAHLKPGSLLVRVGEKVTTGQPIGSVGNSGNSTEPHLHLHAERDGIGLQLLFAPARGRPYRGQRIRAMKTKGRQP